MRHSNGLFTGPGWTLNDLCDPCPVSSSKKLIWDEICFDQSWVRWHYDRAITRNTHESRCQNSFDGKSCSNKSSQMKWSSSYSVSSLERKTLFLFFLALFLVILRLCFKLIFYDSFKLTCQDLNVSHGVLTDIVYLENFYTFKGPFSIDKFKYLNCGKKQFSIAMIMKWNLSSVAK